jgi:hypothetical protein
LALWREPPQEEVLRIVCESLTLILPDYDNLILPTKSAIFKARQRLWPDVMREVAEKVIKPIAFSEAPGAWYNGLRLMSLDGTSFDVPDSKKMPNFLAIQAQVEARRAFLS